MTGLDLDAIEARANATTPGPWHVEYLGDAGYPQRIANDAAVIVGETFQASGNNREPDPEFLASTRTDVPALVAEIRRLRAETRPDITDRQLLAAIHRWARTNGWHCTWIGWADAPMSSTATTVVEWDHDELIVRRRPAAEVGAQWPSGVGRHERYPVTSVRQAVDILCALEVLPARFSSAYRAALEVGR